MNVYGAGEMMQLANRLLCKHGGLSLDPSIHIKSWVQPQYLQSIAEEAETMNRRSVLIGESSRIRELQGQ